MTDSVWWYVLAGFLLGFILSTLWEWLYFRRRRMQIENQRIAELEATVRSFSTVSHSADSNTSSGFAAGYQSPMVFLEGEEDDVDTVEVIVPASPEPIEFDQPVTEQPRAGNQFVAARAAPTGRTSSSNGNGLVHEATGETPKVEPAAVAASRAETTQSTLPAAALVAGAAAATAWTRDKEQTAEEDIVQEQLPEEHIPGLVGDLAPSRQITSVSYEPDEVEPQLAPAQAAEQPEVQPPPPDQQAGTLAPAAAALAAAKVIDDRQATSPVEVQPTTPGTEGATASATADAAGQPTADASSQLTTEPATQAGEAQPVITQTAPTQAAPGQPDSQRREEDSGLTPAGVAVLVSALASTLAGDQQHPPEASQQQAPQPLASSAELPAAVTQVEAPEPQSGPESAPAARVVPIAYAIPDTQPATATDTQDEHQDAEDAGTGVNPDESAAPAERTGPSATAAEAQGPGAADASTGSAPADGEPVAAAADSAIDSGKTPAAVTPQEQEPALPLSAILPRATKPAPLSKSGQARRPDAAPANAVAASGIEPEIEQVSNQLDDLIDSINGLIERTQPLLEQPASQVAPLDALFAPPGPTAGDDYGASDDSGTEEGAATGVTGPYSAQNLSRMEYGLVQLMQAARRLGRDVRSAF